VIVLGRKSISDIPTALLAVTTVIILFTTRRIKEPVIVLVAAVIGLLVYPVVHH
jgi:chromate transporter